MDPLILETDDPDVVQVLPQAATHVKDFKSVASEHLRKIAAGEEVDEPFALNYREAQSYLYVWAIWAIRNQISLCQSH